MTPFGTLSAGRALCRRFELEAGWRLVMADVREVEIVVAHSERVTLRVGDVFLKIDGDQTRLDVGAEAMATILQL